MAPVELEGNNLGEKHKYYNNLLKIAIKDYPLLLPPIDYNDSDVNNMLKIDVACSRKDINYVLEVLKSEDMLYVSKVIKRSNWLFTNEEYAHIINPQYLHTIMFPEMIAKAKNKLVLSIRLNLKNETRVEEFFDYYKNVDLRESLKWLPNCSFIFIENAIKTHKDAINVNILKRLCQKCIRFLTVYLNCKVGIKLKKRLIMKKTIFLMNNHFNEYLDILESLNSNEYPTFSPKYTKLLMSEAPQRVLNNFEKYAERIHLQTLVKFMNPEEISHLLLQNYQYSNLKYWFTEYILDIFLEAMPREKRSQFVIRNVFEKTTDGEHNLMLHARPVDSYHWYKYVEFETAFKDIVKLIKTESSPHERMTMMEILFYSAKKNMKHIEELLQYYRTNHINESLVYKHSFIITVVNQFEIIRVSNQAWDNLNILFLSIEDMESERKEQSFVKASIIRKIINNESVPETLEKSFDFETMKSYIKQLNNKECDLTFNYLYNYAMKQVNQQDISNEIQFQEAITLLQKVLLLLSDWGKDLATFPEVIKAITKLIDLKKAEFKTANLSGLYDLKKSWRKCLFSMSLDLSLSQDVYINTLKHDSKLLLHSNHVKNLLVCSDFTNLQKLLNKIRIYWPSLANETVSFCLDNLNNKGDKAFIKHIMYFIPVNLLKEIVLKYVPKEETIDWNDDKLLLNRRKNIAKHMHVARPQPPIEFVLWYAKGDYLQFGVSSLNSVLYNMKETKARLYIQQLIDAPVSLKKHVIRIAIEKLDYEEVIQLFRNAWTNTKNKSIRAELFKTTFKLLCKEKDISAICCIWTLLVFFIESLTDKENAGIYNTLTKADKVPLSLKADFWQKSVLFFHNLPPSSNQKAYVERVLYSARLFVEIVNTDTLAKVILENRHSDIAIDCDPQFIATCILSTKTIEAQLQRYYKIFLPLMEICVGSWNIKKDNKYRYKEAFDNMLCSLCSCFVRLEKQMTIPVVAFNEILKYIEQNLPDEENYVLLRTWKFSCKYIEIINLNLSLKETSQMDIEDSTGYSNSVLPKLGKEIQNCLNEDIEKYYPSIYICISKAIYLVLCYFNFSNVIVPQLLKSILCADIKESYLLVLDLIPKLVIDSNETTIEILDLICTHPSKEVKLHYYNRGNGSNSLEMATLELQGNNLGERQKYFNKLVNDANKNPSLDEPSINESDISNLVNIDIANANNNVEFILKTLACSDLLFVIRALKKCDWLIKDDQYAHIINPEYLNANLYPRMQTKAILKLKHLIKLKLMNESRAEQFYKYETKPSDAVEWLHKCSIEFIENNFSKHANDMNISQLKRLCERSITFLERYVKNVYVQAECFQKTLFLLHVDVDKYLDIVESQSIYSQPNFGKRATKVLMTKCPKRIIDKFNRYCNYIDTPTFVKYLKDDLQKFLINNIVNKENNNELTRYFSSVKNWSPFLAAMSNSRRIEFINQVFINESISKEKELGKTIMLIRELQRRTPLYHWYKFLPFELALSNIKSMIGPETDTQEKNKMLETIVLSARGNLEHGKSLLQYFRDKHINAPREIRIRFLVNFMSHFKTHNFDEDSWNILQNIIDSLDIQNNEDHDKTVIESLIVYQILHNKNVPEKTVKSFLFNSLKSSQTKLNPIEKETIFKYLLEMTWKEVQSVEINEVADFVRCINSLNGTLVLLKDWNKNVLDYPFVLEKIKQLVKIKQEKTWNEKMSALYNVQKSWRKHMFHESIILSPTEEACINSLKHGPYLFDLYKDEVESMFSKNDVSLTRLLRKVRIYWSETINRDWKNVYFNRLSQSNGQNAITRGLCILLPKEELTMFLNKHAPSESKIDWDNIDELELGLQKCLAKNMHNSRPHPDLETVLSYAKGDFLTYALPSVLAIYYNMSPIQYQEFVSQILNTPVSLQKHGLRLLFDKLSSEKLRESCSYLWKDTKNSTIRTEIFKIVFKLLCSGKDELNIKQAWELLEMLIDDLTFLEDKSIYKLLYKVHEIPKSVRAKFLVKSYNFLKALIESNPQEYGSEWDVQCILTYCTQVIESMPSEFMVVVIEDYVNNEFFKERVYLGEKTKLITSYILCSTTEEEQMKKYDEILSPIFTRSIKLWNEQIKSKYYIKMNTEQLLFDFINELENFIGEMKMIVPVKLFTSIQKMLEQSLPLSETYVLIRTWQLATNLVTLLDKNQPIIWVDTCSKIAPEFGNICKEYLIEDTTSLFPRIYILFMDAFANMIRLFSDDIKYDICKGFIEKEDFLAGYLVALKVTKLLCDDEKIKDIRESIRKHPSVEVKMHYYNMFEEDRATLLAI